MEMASGGAFAGCGRGGFASGTERVGRHGDLWALLREVERIVKRVEENGWTALERE
jgi:hypothetical protein